MAHILDLPDYLAEIKKNAKCWDFGFLHGKSLLVSGASGMVMSYLIDVLLSDESFDIHIDVVTSSGNAQKRFRRDSRIAYLVGDVCDQSLFAERNGYDYVIHAASITDPKGYSTKPIDTMLINFEGSRNLLDVATRNHARFLLLSSCEIYGEADVEPIPESYCGKLDPMDVRSCYNESKRASETLAVAYGAQKGTDVVVARLSRIFGPTMSLADTKAMSQFLFNGVRRSPVVLKSAGLQRYSFTYVADAASAILTLLKNGCSSQAYNVCNKEALPLKEIAKLVADSAGVELNICLDGDRYLQSGYSRAMHTIQDPNQLYKLGWEPEFSIKEGIRRTLNLIKQLL